MRWARGGFRIDADGGAQPAGEPMKCSNVEISPSHMGVEGNEARDDSAEEAAESLGDAIPKAYLRGTSFAH